MDGPDWGEPRQGGVGQDEQHGQDKDGGTEDGEAGPVDEQADKRGEAGSAGCGGADLPGDSVPGSLLSDPLRGGGYEGGENPGQGGAEGVARGRHNGGPRWPHY